MVSRIVATLVAALITPLAIALPEPFSARYELEALGNVIGRTAVSLQALDDGGYRYQSESAAVGLAALLRDERIHERSDMRVATDGLPIPVDYYYRRTGKRERLVEVRFDWTAGIASNTASKQTWQMPIPDGTMDKLNYTLAMMTELEAGRRALHYPIADGGSLKTYELSHLRDERIETAFGALDTVVMQRIRKDSPRLTTFWCAPRLGYLPVKIEHRERDGVLLLLLREFNGQTAPTDSASATPTDESSTN